MTNSRRDCLQLKYANYVQETTENALVKQFWALPYFLTASEERIMNMSISKAIAACTLNKNCKAQQLQFYHLSWYQST